MYEVCSFSKHLYEAINNLLTVGYAIESSYNRLQAGEQPWFNDSVIWLCSLAENLK